MDCLEDSEKYEYPEENNIERDKEFLADSEKYEYPEKIESKEKDIRAKKIVVFMRSRLDTA